MSDQRYREFMARAPIGTRVKGISDLEFVRDHGSVFIKGLEGVIVRHGFEFERPGKKGTTWNEIPIVMFFDNPHEWDVRPADLLYSFNAFNDEIVEWIILEDLLAN